MLWHHQPASIELSATLIIFWLQDVIPHNSLEMGVAIVIMLAGAHARGGPHPHAAAMRAGAPHPIAALIAAPPAHAAALQARFSCRL